MSSPTLSRLTQSVVSDGSNFRASKKYRRYCNVSIAADNSFHLPSLNLVVLLSFQRTSVPVVSVFSFQTSFVPGKLLTPYPSRLFPKSRFFSLFFSENLLQAPSHMKISGFFSSHQPPRKSRKRARFTTSSNRINPKTRKTLIPTLIILPIALILGFLTQSLAPLLFPLTPPQSHPALSRALIEDASATVPVSPASSPAPLVASAPGRKGPPLSTQSPRRHPSAAASLPPAARPARLLHVQDGDSLRVVFLDESPSYHSPLSRGAINEARSRQIPIRLCSIDAPELNQPFGVMARDLLRGEIQHNLLYVLPTERDRFGRTVAQVYLPDGTNLNRLMVSRGYAWHYRAHCKDPVLATLQSQARSGNRGLWATPHPTAPWDFRRQNRRRN